MKFKSPLRDNYTRNQQIRYGIAFIFMRSLFLNPFVLLKGPFLNIYAYLIMFGIFFTDLKHYSKIKKISILTILILGLFLYLY